VESTGRVGVGSKTKSFGADDRPWFFNEAARYPEFESSFDKWEMLSDVSWVHYLKLMEKINIPYVAGQFRNSS